MSCDQGRRIWVGRLYSGRLSCFSESQKKCIRVMSVRYNEFIRSRGSTRRSQLLSTVIVMMKVVVIFKFMGHINL